MDISTVESSEKESLCGVWIGSNCLKWPKAEFSVFTCTKKIAMNEPQMTIVILIECHVMDSSDWTISFWII